MNHGIWLPGLIVAVLGALVITWAIWPLRPRPGVLPRQLALHDLENAMGRAQGKQADDPDQDKTGGSA